MIYQVSRHATLIGCYWYTTIVHDWAKIDMHRLYNNISKVCAFPTFSHPRCPVKRLQLAVYCWNETRISRVPKLDMNQGQWCKNLRSAGWLCLFPEEPILEKWFPRQFLYGIYLFNFMSAPEPMLKNTPVGYAEWPQRWVQMWLFAPDQSVS